MRTRKTGGLGLKGSRLNPQSLKGNLKGWSVPLILKVQGMEELYFERVRVQSLRVNEVKNPLLECGRGK